MRTTWPGTYSTIWNGAPSTESSSRIVTARATGTGLSASAATTRYSRAMSWADGVRPCSGGPAQHPPGLVVVDQEGQIGPPTGDELGPQFAGARNAGSLQVSVQRRQVEPVE